MQRHRLALHWLLIGMATAGLSACSDTHLVYRQAPTQTRTVTGRAAAGSPEKLDILWVVDNSGSMMSYLPDLADNAVSFMQALRQKGALDWRMGLISTTEADNPYLGFDPGSPLDRRSRDPVGEFQRAVQQLGTHGDEVEKAYAPIKKALLANPGFLRRSANLALIIVTDAPEQSPISSQEFLQFLGTLKGNLDRVVTYGVFAPMDFGCAATDDPWNYAGSKYEALVKATHGKTFQLCSGTFGDELSKLADAVTKPQLPVYYLDGRPDLASLHVYAQGKELPGGKVSQGGYWFYDAERNAVVFYERTQADGQPVNWGEVKITYLPESP